MKRGKRPIGMEWDKNFGRYVPAITLLDWTPTKPFSPVKDATDEKESQTSFAERLGIAASRCNS